MAEKPLLTEADLEPLDASQLLPPEGKPEAQVIHTPRNPLPKGATASDVDLGIESPPDYGVDIFGRKRTLPAPVLFAAKPGGIELHSPAEGGPPSEAYIPGKEAEGGMRLMSQLKPEFRKSAKFKTLDAFERDPIAQMAVAGPVGKVAMEAIPAVPAAAPPVVHALRTILARGAGGAVPALATGATPQQALVAAALGNLTGAAGKYVPVKPDRFAPAAGLAPALAKPGIGSRLAGALGSHASLATPGAIVGHSFGHSLTGLIAGMVAPIAMKAALAAAPKVAGAVSKIPPGAIGAATGVLNSNEARQNQEAAEQIASEIEPRTE
jgi:hypothetical protein